MCGIATKHTEKKIKPWILRFAHKNLDDCGTVTAVPEVIIKDPPHLNGGNPKLRTISQKGMMKTVPLRVNILGRMKNVYAPRTEWLRDWG